MPPQILVAAFCTILVAGLILTLLLAHHRRTIHRIERGICIECGYDLRGQVVPRCPECGTAFDPQEISGPDGEPPPPDQD